jgi:low temperature requirement protein LtrA
MLRPRPWRRPLVAREHGEPHRQASWLELFFDLSFVVAVAQAAGQLEEFMAAGNVRSGLAAYLMIFAAIWLAWMAFTWFGNVFDTDDVPYRLLSFVVIAGSLGLAAGIPAMAHLDFRVGVISYVVMRLAYVAQWVRIYRTGHALWRPIAARIILLTIINQAGWVGFLWVPDQWKFPVFVAWFACDVATPWLAGWDARMGGHVHHIVERYGLFTIIVLGESIAAATLAAGRAAGVPVDAAAALTLAVGGLVIVFSLWWIYFDFTSGRAPGRERRAQYRWAGLHYFVFASIAAVGAGLALAVEWLSDPDHVRLSATGVALVVGAAVAIFLLSIGLIEAVAEDGHARSDMLVKVLGAAGAVAAAVTAPVLTVPGSILGIGAVLAAMVGYGVSLQNRLAGHQAESAR